MRRIVLICALILLAVGALVLLRETLRRPAVSPEAAKPVTVRVVTLYFGSADGSSLVAEQMEVKVSDNSLDALRPVLEALLSGPKEAGVALFPQGTRLRGVYISGETAYMDFSQQLVDDFTGGSSGEYLLVASIVQTVCANFPEVHSVKLLIEGRDVDTIGGHLNVSTALRPQDWR